MRTRPRPSANPWKVRLERPTVGPRRTLSTGPRDPCRKERAMKVQMWKLADVKPYPNNPRHNDAAVDAVAASIQRFGFRQPIVVDAQGVIIVGNTRYKAALKLGLQTVPVHVAKELTEAEIKGYRLADNRTADIATWNEELLIQEIMGLQQLDFDIDVTGFSRADLNRLMDRG